VFVGSLTEDIMVGTYGRATIVNENISTLVRLDTIDIISNTTTSVIERPASNGEEEAGGTSSRGTVLASSESGIFFAPESTGRLVEIGSLGGQLSEFAGFFGAHQGEFIEFFRSDEFSLEESPDGSYTADSGEASGTLVFAGQPSETTDRRAAIEAISAAMAGDHSGEALKNPGGDDYSRPNAPNGADDEVTLQQPTDRQERKPDRHQAQILTVENGENGAKADSGLGAAIAGMTGWKVFSGANPDGTRVIELSSFRKLAEKQEKKRFKKWKNAGAGG
jgi:hypothetical protein